MFENRYFASHAMLAEFARKHGTGPRTLLVLGCSVFYAAALALCLWAEIWEEVADTFLIAGFVYMVGFFMPHLFAAISLHTAKSNNDGVLPQTIVTFGDVIEMDEGMIHLTIEYRKIKRVIRLKHSYIMMIGKRNAVMIDPNGFTKGDFESFKTFLAEKRPDLKIPK